MGRNEGRDKEKLEALRRLARLQSHFDAESQARRARSGMDSREARRRLALVQQQIEALSPSEDDQ